MRTLNQVKQHIKSIQAYLVSMSSEDEEIVISRTGIKGGVKGKLRLPPTLTSFTPPDELILGKSDKAVAELYEKSTNLYELRNLVTHSFNGIRGQKECLIAIDKLIEQVNIILNKNFTAIAKTTNRHMPEPVKAAVDSLEKWLLDFIPADSYDGIEKAFYVRKLEDDWQFTSYLGIQNFVNSENYIFDDYQVVLTSEIKDLNVTYFITTLDEFKVPGTFLPGVEITQPSKATQVLQSLFALDDLELADAKPISQKSDISKLKIKGVIDAKIVDNYISIEVKNDMTTINSIITKTLPVVKQVIKGKGRVIPQVVKHGAVAEIRYSMYHKQASINEHKLDVLKNLLDLTPAEIKVVKHALLQ